VASILCGLSILRHQKPPWFDAFLAILLGVFSSLLAIFNGDVLHPSRWPGRIPGQWDSVVMGLAASIPCSIVVATIAVALFQERFKKHLSLEERRELRRRRHDTSWLRIRWFNLIASSALIACFTSLLISLYAGPVRYYDTDATDDYSGAANWSPGSPAPSPSSTKGTRVRPLLEFTEAAAVFSPFCVLGILASGGWLAFTLAYWRGHWQVRPRHRRHFPTPNI
jgi:hypothetical protein